MAQARAQLLTAYGMIEEEMATRTWAMGDAFSMADCAAAPALFYANRVVPFDDDAPDGCGLSGAPDGSGRPSRGCVQEAEPYFALFPG